MSMQSEGKDAKGRNWDQATKDGTTSAGSFGVGATGDIGSMSGSTGAGGNQQSGPTRTDDILSDGSDVGKEDGYVAEEAGELQTGMAGIGSLSTGNAGSRQSADDGLKGITGADAG